MKKYIIVGVSKITPEEHIEMPLLFAEFYGNGALIFSPPNHPMFILTGTLSGDGTIKFPVSDGSPHDYLEFRRNAGGAWSFEIGLNYVVLARGDVDRNGQILDHFYEFLVRTA